MHWTKGSFLSRRRMCELDDRVAEGKYRLVVVLLDYQGTRGPREELSHWTKPTLPPGFAPMILNQPELL